MGLQLFALALAFVAGILLGIYLSRPAKVHAEIPGLVYVQKLDTKTPGWQTIKGGVLGFSCVQAGMGAADCYALTTAGN